MSDTTALLAHIQSLNAATIAWVNEDPAARWACTLTEDMPYWVNECKISTPDEFDHHMLVTDVYEATKSIWGYKPSWKGLCECTSEELRSELAALSMHAKDAIQAEVDYSEWLEAMEDQQKWENPLNEIFFQDGCWKKEPF